MWFSLSTLCIFLHICSALRPFMWTKSFISIIYPKYKINSKTSSRIRKTLEEHLHSSQPFLIDVVKNSIRKTTNTSKIEIYWIKSSYKNSNSKFY
jgi:hypothetical protein